MEVETVTENGEATLKSETMFNEVGIQLSPNDAMVDISASFGNESTVYSFASDEIECDTIKIETETEMLVENPYEMNKSTSEGDKELLVEKTATIPCILNRNHQRQTASKRNLRKPKRFMTVPEDSNEDKLLQYLDPFAKVVNSFMAETTKKTMKELMKAVRTDLALHAENHHFTRYSICKLLKKLNYRLVKKNSVAYVCRDYINTKMDVSDETIIPDAPVNIQQIKIEVDELPSNTDTKMDHSDETILPDAPVNIQQIKIEVDELPSNTVKPGKDKTQCSRRRRRKRLFTPKRKTKRSKRQEVPVAAAAARREAHQRNLAVYRNKNKALNCRGTDSQQVGCQCHSCGDFISGAQYRCVQCYWWSCAKCEMRGLHAHHHVVRGPARAQLRPNEIESILDNMRKVLKNDHSLPKDYDWCPVKQEVPEPDPLMIQQAEIDSSDIPIVAVFKHNEKIKIENTINAPVVSNPRSLKKVETIPITSQSITAAQIQINTLLQNEQLRKNSNGKRVFVVKLDSNNVPILEQSQMQNLLTKKYDANSTLSASAALSGCATAAVASEPRNTTARREAVANPLNAADALKNTLTQNQNDSSLDCLEDIPAFKICRTGCNRVTHGYNFKESNE